MEYSRTTRKTLCIKLVKAANVEPNVGARGRSGADSCLRQAYLRAVAACSRRPILDRKRPVWPASGELSKSSLTLTRVRFPFLPGRNSRASQQRAASEGQSTERFRSSSCSSRAERINSSSSSLRPSSSIRARIAVAKMYVYRKICSICATK